MEKINDFKNQFKDFVEQNQKLVIGITAGVVICVLLLFNMSLIQISYYKITQDTQKMVNVLAKEVKEVKNHQKVYFKSGLDYLIEDMSEISTVFFEKYFSYLSLGDKEKVLTAYNEKDILFASQQIIIDEIAKGNKSDVMDKYLNRLDMNTFELALVEYFGKDPEPTQDIVNKLYNVASMYEAKLPMDKFIVSIYEIMKFPELATENSMALKLLDVIEPEAIYRVLFTELKTQGIEVDLLNAWVDVLNKKQAITTQEYASFTNSYNSIKQLRDQYTQLQRQEVDIKNVKEKIDVETSENRSKVDKLTKEIEAVRAEMDTKKLQLINMKTYKSMDLYIMDYYDDGRYEASIPEKSWFFGTYKPSNQKVRIKLTTSQPDSQGVFNFDVYYKGKTEEGIPYYVEVSQENKNDMATLESELTQKRAIVEQKEVEKEKLQADIDKIRKANNYDQNNILLEEVNNKKENVLLRLKEKQIEIQTLFGIGNVSVEVNKK
ncbi:MAG: hypothetical protein RSD26_03040 [Cellulosilyticaceae bacterium]